MDYEKLYKEALERAKKLYEQGTITESLSYVFPELAESDDEKIRRELIDYINRLTASPNYIDKYNTWIAWLEKQGEKKAIIEMKSPEESLGIDSVTYNNIVDECIYGEQKPAWSEDDERMRQETIDWFEKKCFPYALEHENPARESIKWLKSLKNRVIPQPEQGWSEEDEEYLRRAIKATKEVFPVTADWLKSLKQRIKWKPTKEQMDALDSTLQYSQVSHNSFEHLNSLFNDLKKLK